MKHFIKFFFVLLVSITLCSNYISCSPDVSANENLVTNTNEPQLHKQTKSFSLQNMETQKSFGKRTVNFTKAYQMTQEASIAYMQLESHVLHNRYLTKTPKIGYTEHIDSTDGGYDPNQDLVWHVVYTYYQNNSGFGQIDGCTYLFIIRRK